MILGSIDITQLLSLLAFNRDEPMLFTSGLFWVLFLLFLPVYSLFKSRRKKMMLFVIAFSLFFFYRASCCASNCNGSCCGNAKFFFTSLNEFVEL